MPSPSTSSSVSIVVLSNNLNIDALLGPTKWGGAIGTGTDLSVSFPWANSSVAYFAKWNANTQQWLSTDESASSSHFGLNALQQAAARSAILSWASVADIGAYEVTETRSIVGDIRFTWTTDQSQGAAWGWASYPWNQPPGGDVSIHASTGVYDSSTGSWASGSFNFEALIHEVGHALGLKHPFDGTVVLPLSQDNTQYTVMAYDSAPHSLYYSFDGQYWNGHNVSPETPMVLDIAAIQYIYGANTTYHTGNDTYTFDPAKPFYKTLWDAAGSDTLSAANFALPCRINLTPGSYSSLGFALPSVAGATYDGTDNLGIAYGCIIENAEGGSGSDTFIGSSANNQFRGNAGSDTLDGSSGIDTALFSGSRTEYVLKKTGDIFMVMDTTGAEGTDTLASIERLQFSDKKIAIDLETTGHAGQAMEFIGALASSLLNDAWVRGTIISLFDQGYTMESISQLALTLKLLPTDSNADLANAVYHNVLGGAASQETTNGLVAYIESYGQAKFLATVAGMHINVDLVGLQQTGVEYLI